MKKLWCDGDSESYATFTQRTLVHQRTSYASLTFAQQQRRLRIHLQRILLLHNGAYNRATDPPVHGSKNLPTSDWNSWREEAVAREQLKVRRHASAQTIQLCVRRWLTSRTNVELPCVSEWIAIVSPATHPLQSGSSKEPIPNTVRRPVSRTIPTHENEVELPPTPATLTEPFQVVIELLGIRDLALGQQKDPVNIAATVRLVHEPTNDDLGGLEATVITSTMEDISWDDQVLQRGVNAADRVLVGGAIHVEIFSSPPKRTALGRLTVALDLLETPLADQYAMTRWFPLERGRGRPTKGEVRLGIRFFMRNPKRSRDYDDVWVPYAAPQHQPFPSTRQGRIRSVTAKKTPPVKPPLSPRKRNTQCALPQQGSGRQTRSPVRYARVEAMSPPSSPSSLSSDSNMEFSPTKAAASPSPPRGLSPVKRPSSGGVVSSANKQKKSVSGGIKVGSDEGDMAAMSRSLSPHGETDEPVRPLFLKRKPHKVVFQKLDWSRVNSKTDSNWGTAGKNGSASSPRAVVRQASENAPATITATPSTSAGDSVHSERLATVAKQLYAACHVTKETAPLAQMRFRNERKRWLENLMKATVDKKPSPTGAASEFSEDSLHSLWMDVVNDPDGSKYVARLRAVTDKISKPTAVDTSSSTCT